MEPWASCLTKQMLNVGIYVSVYMDPLGAIIRLPIAYSKADGKG